MDTFGKIKKILEFGSGKAVVLDEGGNPSYVIMNWKEYERLLVVIDTLRTLPTPQPPRPQNVDPSQLTLKDLPL